MIYLDHNATTPLHPAVFRAMEPYMREQFGNASSSYRLGRSAKSALEASRKSIAGCLGAQPDEIVFTGGGTESDNIAIRGVAHALRSKGNHVITSHIEHHAVLNTCQDLEREGFRVTYLPVDSGGQINPDDVRSHIGAETILITVMLANNETGVIQPLSEVGKIAREEQIIFHTDAVQAVGKIPVDVNELSVDLLSLSGHKFYGPKGVGALYVRRNTPINPPFTGGHHERNIRPGTENVPGIVGLAEALLLATGSLPEVAQKLTGLRQRFEATVLRKINGVQINGRSAPRVHNTSNMSFQSIEGESILLHLDLKGIYASSGSACSTDSPEPSHVLVAMGVPAGTAQGTIRFSLGKDNTDDQIDYVMEALMEITARLREISSVRDK
ncbi:MAG: cysteine desulfurase NifS [Deltaproteobacteria bacterium]|nr:cysteine desulfurase NifS [Deltaproteobacteria bacterium]